MISCQDLQDFRFFTNPYIIEELSKRVIQQLHKRNKPNLLYWNKCFIFIADFKNIGCIDVYSAINDKNDIVKICGFVVTRVELFKLKTIDEVFRICTSQENHIFTLKETTLYLYQNEEERIHRFIFSFSSSILVRLKKIFQPGSNDRIFNILSPRLDHLYFGYQKENHFDQVEIYDYSRIDRSIIFLYSTENFKNMKKISELLKEKPKCNKLMKKYNNGKLYKRI